MYILCDTRQMIKFYCFNINIFYIKDLFYEKQTSLSNILIITYCMILVDVSDVSKFLNTMQNFVYYHYMLDSSYNQFMLVLNIFQLSKPWRLNIHKFLMHQKTLLNKLPFFLIFFYKIIKNIHDQKYFFYYKL